ncbi:competence protein ComK [Alkalibacillus sp. S2W]|uniref:competence protein ComK n=1 Tax=Alkalibacillus TaxID=331654 RepID=UPI0014247C87|nr:competence protein ComK [Alkalibacillus almallahensis]
MRIEEEARVSTKTMAVLPYEFSEGIYGSYVVDQDDEFYSYSTPKQLINEACHYYFCSLKGRLEGTRKVFGINRKLPIVIEPSCNMYFMPTTSPLSHDCAWISHGYVESLERLSTKETCIKFNGGKALTVPYSYNSLNNQLFRTAQYRHMITDRLSKPSL